MSLRRFLILLSFSLISTSLLAQATDENIPRKFSLDIPALTADKGFDLNIQHKVQHDQVWCWATVSAMAIQYYNGNFTEDCEVVSYVLNARCCSNNRPQQCSTPGGIDLITKILNNGDIKTQRTGILSLNQVAEVVYKLRSPIIIFLNNPNGQIGHYMMIHGFDLDRGALVISDPMIAGPFLVSYNTLGNYNGLVWQLSLIMAK